MPVTESEIDGNPRERGFKKDKLAGDTKRAIDWKIVEREYIFGIVTEGKKGDFDRVYPSLRKLSNRFRIPHPTVGYYARKGNWGDRREKFRDHLRSEFDKEVAKARALSAGDALGILDGYIRKFKVAVEKDAVGRSSIKDLDVALRLKAFVQKEVDRSEDATTTLNLSQLQARHASQRESAALLTEPEVGFIDSRTDREAAAFGPAPSIGGSQPAVTEPAPTSPVATAPAATVQPPPATPPKTNPSRYRKGDGRPRGALAAPRGWPSAARSSIDWGKATRALARYTQPEESWSTKAAARAAADVHRPGLFVRGLEEDRLPT